MREWNLGVGDPLTLTLAADVRLSSLNYTDDQIWELLLGSADPAAVVLHTTYGLRARSMRLFPRFLEGDTSVSSPQDFDSPPRVRQFFPNYLKLTFSPFAGIDVEAEYWAPECNVVAGRLRLVNNGVTPRKFTLEWVSLLNPIGEGVPMTPTTMEGVQVLAGQTNKLAPLVFMTGGPTATSSPYPSLDHQVELLPGAARQLTWVHAATQQTEESFRLARLTAARNWQGEIARVEITNAGQLTVQTGDPEWDAVFALGQKVALSLLHSPSEHLPHPSFVFTRQPDQGYSNQKDGKDYGHLWNGQTALDAWYLTQMLLPGEAEVAKGLVRNFVAAQREDGYIDWKPGLAGQRGRMLATPILATLAWRIYQFTEDEAFLAQTFPHLLDFVHAWFSEAQDRDGDGIPEWDHPMQSGFDENPTFAPWHAWAQGADITFFEGPDLCSLLFAECQSLIKIAEVLERSQPVPALQALADNLHSAVDASWYGRTASYRYWDRDTHRSQAGELLGKRTGAGEILLDMVFDLPERFMLRIESSGDPPLQAHVFVHGSLPTGKHRVERVDRGRFQWFHGVGTATGDLLYAEVERVEIKGIGPQDKVSLRLLDCRIQNQASLLPLWASMPDAHKAKKLVQRAITNAKKYARPFGLPACPKTPRPPKASICQAVWPVWNTLIGEGLLAYGARQESADLVARLMAAMIDSLKREHAFRRHYHAENGQGFGERNALAGLPPLGLFLETLGVRVLSPWRVALKGANPFPWPVKIQYRGLVVDRSAEKTVVVFPDGRSVTVEDEAPCIVDGRPLPA